MLALSHDELGVIVDGFADPLQPVVAVALSSTCKGLRTPLRAALEVLKKRHARAAALCRKVGTSFTKLRNAAKLYWLRKGLTADDMATLAMILQTNGLPRMREIDLPNNNLGDAGVQALCEGLGHQASLLKPVRLGLFNTNIGDAGAQALCEYLGHHGALLLELDLSYNHIRSQGAAALAAPLRKHPALKKLFLTACEIGDEGVASLFANLGKDDFKALERLWLKANQITDAGMATLVAALDAGRLPRLLVKEAYSQDEFWFLPEFGFLGRNRASASALQAVKDALANRSQ